MALKFIALCCLLATTAHAGLIGAHAGLIGAPAYAAAPAYGYAAPAYAAAPAIAKVAVQTADYDPNPQYSYGYNVEDALTGDSKNQQESRSGDVVQGSYSLTDPDGTRRTVEYAADPVNGFNAVVRREPIGVKAVAAYAAPAAYAPAAYAAPAYGYARPALAAAYARPAIAAYARPAIAAYAAPAAYARPAYASYAAPAAYARPAYASYAAPAAYARPAIAYASPAYGSPLAYH